MDFLTDEHVPRVFVRPLRSSGHDVTECRTALGEAAADEAVLAYCASEGRVLITHDKKDFAGDLTRTTDHHGVVIYTDANALRDDPEGAVHVLDRILDHVSDAGLRDTVVWLDEWRR